MIIRDKCHLWFDKAQITNAESLITNSHINTGTPDFSKIADTDEGVYQTTDGMYSGTTYYWRGSVNNNYVQFARFCWRIIRINGDKTIRLIYDGSTCHTNGTDTAESIAVTSQAYNPDYTQSNYVGWTYSGTSQRTLSGDSSNAKSQTENWYNSHIGNNSIYASKVADGKFCNDRDVENGYTWAISPSSAFNYAGYKRILTDYNPTFSCPSGDTYTLKVGAITADEVEFAGGKNTSNTSYYLYNGQHYWTISPDCWGDTQSYAVVFCVAYGIEGRSVLDTTPGLRPVINLKADVTFSSGDGTKDKPYIVAN